jgi:predicted lysophospholipase L1 biosynthesis ABC-type transport system permease subunit
MYLLDRWPREAGLGAFALSGLVALTVYLTTDSVVWLVIASWLFTVAVCVAGLVLDLIAHRREGKTSGELHPSA